jgi:hypothetical protein
VHQSTGKKIKFSLFLRSVTKCHFL